MAEKLRERHGVQHTVGRPAAFSSHLAPIRESSALTDRAFGLMLMISADQALSQEDDLILGLPVIEQPDNKHTRRDCQEIE
jgi:hypothetical protein